MNERFMKNFNGDKIFCLEYDKETLKDMVIEKQEEIERLNNIIGTIKGMFKDNDNHFEDGCDCERIENFLEILDKENK